MTTLTLTVTANDIIARGPCLPEYPPERVQSLMASRDSWSAVQILREIDVPPHALLWAVLDESLIPVDTLHEFGCRCTERRLLAERDAGREPDPRTWTAISMKREWLAGRASVEQLRIAAESAWSAAQAAAQAAGLSLMVVEAHEAAIAAHWVATHTEPWAAIPPGVWAAEPEWQVSELLRMLEEAA